MNRQMSIYVSVQHADEEIFMHKTGTSQQCIDCVDIAGRSFARGVKEGW